MAIQMISIGENRSELDQMLMKLLISTRMKWSSQSTHQRL